MKTQLSLSFISQLVSQTLRGPLVIGSLLLLSEQVFAVRSEVARFKTIHDKTRSEELYRQMGHDFIFDITARESRGLLDLIDEGQDVSKQSNASVVSFLRRNLETEHYGNVNVKLGIPLPKFTIKGITFEPSFRGTYDIAASLSLTELNSPIVIAGITVADNDPFIQLYLKEDRKYGGHLKFDLPHDMRAEVFLYYMRRWDRLEAVTASGITRDGKVIDLNRPKNSVQSVTSDLTLEYEVGASRFMIAAEELRFKTISAENQNGELYFGGNVPLFRFHAERTFNPGPLTLNAFLGVHKRSGYQLGDGVYGGGEFSFKDFPLSALGMLDSDYITLNPRLRFWIFHLEYSAKLPIDERTEGNARTATLHAVNFRIFI